MTVLKSDYIKLLNELKAIDKDFEIDIRYWVCYGKPAFRKILDKNDYMIELSIYYNYKKELVTKLTKERILNRDNNGFLHTTEETFLTTYDQPKQASKKALLEKVKELKNIKLEDYLEA